MRTTSSGTSSTSSKKKSTYRAVALVAVLALGGVGCELLVDFNESKIDIPQTDASIDGQVPDVLIPDTSIAETGMETGPTTDDAADDSPIITDTDAGQDSATADANDGAVADAGDSAVADATDSAVADANDSAVADANDSSVADADDGSVPDGGADADDGSDASLE